MAVNGLHTPRFELHVNNEAMTSDLAQRAMSLEIVDDAGFESDSLTLTIDDRDDVLIIPPAGAKIEAYIGYGDELSYYGSYTYDEVTCELVPRKMLLTAKSINMTSSIKSSHTQAYENTTLGEIVAEVAGRHGLAHDVHSSINNNAIKYIEQDDESDMNLLRRIAVQENVLLKWVDETIVMQPLAENRNDTDTIWLDVTKIHTGTVKYKSRNNFKKAKAAYHDNNDGQDKYAEAKVESSETESNNSETTFALKHNYSNETEAQRAAQAVADKASRETAELDITLDGDLRIRADKKIGLRDAGNKFSGVYSVKSVTHTINTDGYTTTLTAKQTKKLRDETASDEQLFNYSDQGYGQELPNSIASIINKWFNSWV